MSEDRKSSQGITCLKGIKALTKHLFGQANVITVPRILVALTGDHVSAILLNQIIYWSERTADPEGWFYKTTEDWHREIGITYSQLEYAIDKRKQNLKGLGVETCVRKVQGVPKAHYRLNQEIFYPLLLRFLESEEIRLSENSKVGKPKVSVSENSKVMDSQKTRKSMNKEAESTSEITHTHRAGFAWCVCGFAFHSPGAQEVRRRTPRDFEQGRLGRRCRVGPL